MFNEQFNPKGIFIDINGRTITNPLAQTVTVLAGAVGGLGLGIGLGIGIPLTVLGALATASIIGAPLGIPAVITGVALIVGGSVIGGGGMAIGFSTAYAIDVVAEAAAPVLGGLVSTAATTVVVTASASITAFLLYEAYEHIIKPYLAGEHHE